jgi:membrane protein required for colicin V production
MSTFDIVIIGIIAVFGLIGLWFGIVHTLGSLIGTVAGVYLASRYYAILADWLIKITGWGGNFPKVVAFIVAFIIIDRLVGLVFWLLDKFLSIFTRLPFIRGINRLLGLAFGLAEGVIVVGMTFYFMNYFPLSGQFMNMAVNSKIVPYTLKVASILWPLLPKALTILQNTVGQALHT